VSQKGTFFFYIVHLASPSSLRSVLFVRPKRTEPKKKGAGNANCSLFVRSLHVALTRHQKGCSSHHFRFALALCEPKVIVHLSVSKFSLGIKFSSKCHFS